MLCYAVQDVKGIHSHVSLWTGKTDKGVVEEDVEPLLIKFVLLSNQVSLACIYNLIILDMILEVLNDLDPQIEIMLSVSVYQLTHILPFIGALSHNVAVVFEQVIDEELVEEFSRAALDLLAIVLVDFAGEGLAEDQRVYEAA